MIDEKSVTDEVSDFLDAIYGITGILGGLSERNLQSVVTMIVAMYALGVVEDDRAAAKNFLRTTFARDVAGAFDAADAVHRHTLLIQSKMATKQ